MITWKDKVMLNYMAKRVDNLEKEFKEIEECYSKKSKAFNMCKIKFSDVVDKHYQRGITIDRVESEYIDFYFNTRRNTNVVKIDGIVVYDFHKANESSNGFVHSAPEEVKLEVSVFIKELYEVYKLIEKTKKSVHSDLEIEYKEERRKLDKRYGK